MQTDAWLTETSHSDCCPLCSQPLAGNSNICPSCGFTAHTSMRGTAFPVHPSTSAHTSKKSDPITPIPPRASAQRAQSSPGQASRRSMPSPPAGSSSRASSERQARGWRHNSPNYEAASSLSSLSLIISETPTAPPRSPRERPRSTERPEHIDEIDTVPPPPPAPTLPSDIVEEPVAPGSVSLSLSDLDAPSLALILSEAAVPASSPRIDEIDTVPVPGEPPSRALQLVRPEPRELAVNAASWTADPSSVTSLVARSRRHRSPRDFNPLDRARWWLLRPGHIEFLLWLAGSVLLFGLTFLLLLATVLNLILPGGGNLPNSAASSFRGSQTGVMTPATSSQPHLALLSKATLSPGAGFRLQGQGFRPHSRVAFLLDGRWPLLDQHRQAASVLADPSGRFTVSLWLGQGAAWSAGHHQILAREGDTGFRVSISITITSSSTTPASNNPLPPAYPTPARPQSTPTPARPTPAPTHVPTPTATAGITPAPSSTVPPKGSVTPAKTTTAAQGSDTSSSSLGNSLNTNQSDSLFARLAHLNPLVWVIGICYGLSMLLLGLAGILRRRHR